MHYLAVAFDDLKHDPAVADSILEDITIQGVTEINQQGVKLRILIKTVPGMQWAVQRSYNRYVKMRFDERSEEHTSELQSRGHLVCRLLLEKTQVQFIIG